MSKNTCKVWLMHWLWVVHYEEWKLVHFSLKKQKKSAKKLQTEKIHILSDSEASSIKTMKVIFVYYAILLSFLWILQKNILALVCIGPIRKQQTAKG